MPASREENKRKGQSEVPPQTLQQWHKLIDELPDVRLEKVRATREALKNRTYDGDEILDEVVRRLSSEIGITPPCGGTLGRE